MNRRSALGLIALAVTLPRIPRNPAPAPIDGYQDIARKLDRAGVYWTYDSATGVFTTWPKSTSGA